MSSTLQTRPRGKFASSNFDLDVTKEAYGVIDLLESLFHGAATSDVVT